MSSIKQHAKLVKTHLEALNYEMAFICIKCTSPNLAMKMFNVQEIDRENVSSRRQRQILFNVVLIIFFKVGFQK